MAETKIEWTKRPGTVGRTWNPTTGCDRISAGCDNCYALTLAKRLKAMGSAKYQTDGDARTSGPGFGVATHPDSLGEPLKWRKPATVFVNSMSDLWHARVPREFVVRIFAVMAATPQHTYQILTKRPERMARMLASDAFMAEVQQAYDALTLSTKAPASEATVELDEYPGYFVSNLGRVFSTSGCTVCGWCGIELAGSIRRMFCSAAHRSKAFYEQSQGRWSPPERAMQALSSDVGEQGHRRVTLYRDGASTRELVHRLVLTAFARPAVAGEQGRHLDSDPSNNVISNLAWGSQSDNWGERVRHGHQRSYAKLTESDVAVIRARSAAGESASGIAKDYPVTDTQIRNVVTGHQWRGHAGTLTWPLPGVWLGTSIESAEHVGRADHLRATPAAVRFISAEPLLGPLDDLDLTDVSWLIAGGESGPGSRPMDLDWVRALIGACRETGTAPFVKQLGAVWAGGGKGGDWSLWPEDLRIREYPSSAEAVADV